MKSEMKDKKLLMTVSSINCKYIIEKAHEMGVKVVIANSNDPEKASLKRLADEKYVIDASNIDEMVRFVQTNRIDGMFVTGSDAHLRFYSEICIRAGLNAYCTPEQVEIISNKKLFKQYCKKFGLNVIPEYKVTGKENVQDIKMSFPVMVKSADNSGGSLGMTLVYKEEDLSDAIDFAKRYSPSGSVVIEEYFDSDEFVINYMFVNGKPYVLYTKDYCKNIVNGRVMRDNAMISPSKYENLFYEKADAQLKKMFSEIGLKNGIIFLQCFVKEDELYFFEGGCRPGGADEYFLWNDIYNIDFHKAMINFALQGDYGIDNLSDILECTKQKRYESVLNVLINAGRIASIDGTEKLKEIKGVLCSTVIRNIGETVADNGTAGQIGIRIMISSEDKNEYIRTVDEIYSNIHFIDSNGCDMIRPRIELEHWLF